VIALLLLRDTPLPLSSGLAITAELPAAYVDAFQHAKIWTAKGLQHTLWTTRWGFVYQGKPPDMFYGVAAMPSLHVAAVVLLAYFLARLSPFAGVIGIAYALAIAIGSVFLQWHYAVDGYAGALLAALTAWIAVRLPATVPLRRL
jgi:membrane-associated phospholipid phosphatase